MTKRTYTLRTFFACFKRELRALWLWLVILLVATLISVALLSTQKPAVEDATLPISYSLSIVPNNDDDQIIQYIASEVENIDFVGNVYIDTPTEAQTRIKSDDTLLSLTLQEGFVNSLKTGVIKSPVVVNFNTNFPLEAKMMTRGFAGLLRSLSYMNYAGITYQELYTDYTGKEDMSWLKLSTMALGMLAQFGTRYTFLVNEDVAAFIGLEQVLAPFLLILAIIPGLVLLDQRMGAKNTAFNKRLAQQGVETISSLAQFISHLLLAVVLCAPFIIFSALIINLSKHQILAISLYALGAALSSLLLAFIGSQFFSERKRALLSTSIIFLAFLFLSGMVTPLELLPPIVEDIARFSPWRGYYEGLLQNFVLSAKVDSSKMVGIITPVVILLVLTLITRKRDQSQ